MRTNWNLQWNQKAEDAFIKIKRALQNSIMLTYAKNNDDWQYVVSSDWSPEAIAWALEQEHKISGDRILLAVGSEKMKGAQRILSAPAGELLSVVRANQEVDKMFGLEGTHRIIENDHKSLITIVRNIETTNPAMKRKVAYINQLNYTWKHRKGTDMKLVDALNRQYQTIEEKNQTLEDMILSTINQVKEHIGDHKQQDIIEAQLNCPETMAIKVYLKEGDWPQIWKSSTTLQAKAIKTVVPRIAFEFIQKDNILFRTIEHSHGVTKQYMYIPVVKRLQMIKRRHDSIVGGHPGAQAVHDSLMQNGAWWIGMMNDIEEFIKNCTSCDVNKARFKKYGDMAIGPGIKQDDPLTIQMDLVGPLPKTNLHNQYLLTMSNRATGKITVVPIKNKEARSVAKGLVEELICKEGYIPQVIQTDNGKEFTANIIKNIANLMKFKLTHSSPYAPYVQGGVERMHQDLERYLRCFVDADQKNWDTLIPYAVFAFNTTTSTARGESPVYLHNGHNSNYFPELAKVIKLYNIGSNSNNYDNAWRRAKHLLMKNKLASKKYQDGKHQPHTFKVNDMVRLKKQAVKKGLVKKLGPKTTFIRYKIIELTGANDKAVRLQNITNDKDIIKSHVNNIKLANNQDPKPTLQEASGNEIIITDDIGELDDPDFDVEKIIEHKKIKRGDYDLKVRFTGYDADYDLWIPEKTLKESAPDKVKEYWKSNKR